MITLQLTIDGDTYNDNIVDNDNIVANHMFQERFKFLKFEITSLIPIAPIGKNICWHIYLPIKGYKNCKTVRIQNPGRPNVTNTKS